MHTKFKKAKKNPYWNISNLLSLLKLAWDKKLFKKTFSLYTSLSLFNIASKSDFHNCQIIVTLVLDWPQKSSKT